MPNNASRLLLHELPVDVLRCVCLAVNNIDREALSNLALAAPSLFAPSIRTLIQSRGACGLTNDEIVTGITFGRRGESFWPHPLGKTPEQESTDRRPFRYNPGMFGVAINGDGAAILNLDGHPSWYLILPVRDGSRLALDGAPDDQLVSRTPSARWSLVRVQVAQLRFYTLTDTQPELFIPPQCRLLRYFGDFDGDFGDIDGSASHGESRSDGEDGVWSDAVWSDAVSCIPTTVRHLVLCDCDSFYGITRLLAGSWPSSLDSLSIITSDWSEDRRKRGLESLLSNAPKALRSLVFDMPWCSDDWLSCFQALFCYLGSTRDHLESLVLKAELEPIYMLSLFVVLKFFPRLRVLSVALDIGTLPSILDQVLQNVPAQVQQLTLSIQPFTGHAIMSCGITSRIEFPHALRDLTIELPPIRSLESEFVLPPNLERLTLIGSLRGENTFAFLLPRLPAALKTLALEFHLFGQSKNGAYKSLLVEYLPQHLESLTVYMGNLTFDDVTALAVRGWPTTLRRLDFRHNALVDLPPLFPPRLRYLGIAHNSMRESDGAWVAALPNTVRVIDLKAVDVKAAWIPHLLAWAAQVWEEHAVRVELRGSFYYLPRALRAQLQEAFMLPH